WKGDGIPIRGRGRTNVFQFPALPHTEKYHPTQKPIDLLREIIRTFAWPGTLAMVPFLGSGATLRALYQEQILGFGWDLNPKNKAPFIAHVEKDISKYLEEEQE
ncbi:MAG: DNA methyltransferase, partial [Acidobacteriota bacterium]